jgi:hypothetical protein
MKEKQLKTKENIEKERQKTLEKMKEFEKKYVELTKELAQFKGGK